MKYENLEHAKKYCSLIYSKKEVLRALKKAGMTQTDELRPLAIQTVFDGVQAIEFDSEHEFNLVKQILIAQTEKDIAKLEAELELL